MNKRAAIGTLLFVTTGAALGVGISSLIVMLTKKDKSIPRPLPTPIENIGEKNVDNIKELSNLEIIQWPSYEVEGQNPETDNKIPNFTLSTTEFAKLKNRIVNELPYGPEIMNLKRIVIDDLNLNSKSENGVYLPFSNEIGISTRSIFGTADGSGNIDLALLKSLSSDEKVEMIFEVLYHEYGHHLAYSYISSPLYKPQLNIKEDIQNIYTRSINNKGDISYKSNSFNKNFVDFFKQGLNYNSTNKMPKPAEKDLIKFGQSRKKGWPVASRLSLKDLYDNANTKESIIKDAENEYFYYPFPNYNSSTMAGSYGSYPASSLQYLYSLEELFTRKYELSTLGFSKSALTIFNNDSSRIRPTLFQDLSKYLSVTYDTKSLTTIGKILWNSIINSYADPYGLNSKLRITKYYDDDPFKNAGNLSQAPNVQTPPNFAESFSQTMSKYMGRAQSEELTYISSKNSFENLTDSIGHKNDNYKEHEINEIKLGGYIPQKDIILLNADKIWIGSINNKFSEINILKRDLKYKKDIFERIASQDVNGSDDMWVSNDYIDAKNIAYKNLYFVYEINGVEARIPLTTMRGVDPNNEGTASNWLEYYPSESASNKKYNLLWYAKKHNNSIQIADGGQYHE